MGFRTLDYGYYNELQTIKEQEMTPIVPLLIGLSIVLGTVSIIALTNYCFVWYDKRMEKAK